MSARNSISSAPRQDVVQADHARGTAPAIRPALALLVVGAILVFVFVWAGTASARTPLAPATDSNGAGTSPVGATPSPTPTCIAPGTYRVLLAYADQATPPTTLRTALLAQPSVGAVDLFDANAGTPTLAQLQQYQVVFTFSNNVYADPDTLGNNLADYQDGGGIVVASFGSFYNAATGYPIGGRWQSGGYSPYDYIPFLLFTSASLGTYDPTHPLMQGVTALNAVARVDASPAAGATEVAQFSDGSSAVAYKTTAGHTAVGITAYIGNGVNHGAGDYAQVIVNAARWLDPLPCATPSATSTATGTHPPATPTRTHTPGPSPTPTATSCPPGTPGPWAIVSPIPINAEGVGVDAAGNRAYAAGGYNGSAVNLFASYDPVANSWSTLPPMPIAADSPSVVYAPNVNRVFVFGGDDSGGIGLTSDRIYDPGSNSWSAGAPMPAGRTFMASGYFNGKIYLVGGAVSIFGGGQPQVWEYDPVTDSYNTGRANMPQGVASAGYGIVNGHFYVLGGFNASGNYLNTIYDYDIAGNSWTLLSVTLPVGPGVASPASAVLGNRIMFIGGFDFTPGVGGIGTIAGRGKLKSDKGVPDRERAITYIFDPQAGTVTNGAPLNEARSLAGGTYVNGYVIAVGGYNGTTYVGTNERSTAGMICPTSTPTPTVTFTATITRTPTITATYTATLTPTNAPTRTTTAVAVTPTSIGVPTATPTVCLMDFADVQPGDWFFSYVQWMYCHGVISGYSASPPCEGGQRHCFKPNNNTTRGQVTKIVVLAFGFPINTTGGPHFTDVPVGSTFYPYVETARNLRVVDGYADGTFRPNNNVTRGQIAKIVVLAAIAFDPAHWSLIDPSENAFEDVQRGSTFYQYVETAATHGIIAGYQCGGVGEPCNPPGFKPYFRPYNNTTRAQISKIVFLSVIYVPLR